MRVLIVEDDPYVSSAVVTILHYFWPTWETIVAGSVCEAWNHMTQLPDLDLLIVDGHLHDEKGAWVVELAQGRPCMGMTGDPEALQALREAGCYDVLSKPFKADELRGAIRQLVKATCPC